MNILIREITKADYNAVHGFIVNSLGYNNDKAALFERLDGMNSGVYHTMVAENDGKVVGFIGFYVLEAYEFSGGYIRVLALASDINYHGMGICSALLSAVEKYAADNSIPVISLNSGEQRTDAHQFYEKRGYKKYCYGFKKVFD